jgi:hypothetical protein
MDPDDLVDNDDGASGRNKMVAAIVLLLGCSGVLVVLLAFASNAQRLAFEAAGASTRGAGAESPDTRVAPDDAPVAAVVPPADEAPVAGVPPVPLPETAAVSIITRPPRARVRHGAEVLCEQTPCTVRLPRGADAVSLTLERKGYEPVVVDVLPTTTDPVVTTLPKIPERGKPGGREGPQSSKKRKATAAPSPFRIKHH